jgi:ABC-type hemin transport system ATPase subunit
VITRAFSGVRPAAAHYSGEVLILDEPHAPTDVEHVRLVFRRAHAELEHRLQGIFSFEERIIERGR